MKYLLPFLVAVLVVGGCETSHGERTGQQAEPSQSSEGLASDAPLGSKDLQHLVERAEQVRDRSFDTPPTFQQVASVGELPDRRPAADAVAKDRRLLVEQLFGLGADELESSRSLAIGEPPYARLARFDADRDRIVYVQDSPRANQRIAILAAVVVALDARQFGALPASSSWDGRLAAEAVRQATVTWALASYLVDKDQPDHDIDLLSKRPGLAAELPFFASWLAPPPPTRRPEQLPALLAARQQRFVVRQGLALAAALYRSSGWSGVELSRLRLPKRSSDVVGPNEWMSGESVGAWTWPAEQSADQPPPDSGPRAGTVGPAVMAMWLDDVTGPRLARTVYAGYMSDAYRFFETGDTQPTRFEWLSLWAAPADARQVARAFEKRLRDRFAAAESPGDHFVVFQKGLKVGVLLMDAPSADLKRRAQKLLEHHRVTLPAREGLATDFVPTRHDQIAEASARATLEGGVWKDPATRLRIDLSALDDDWRVQQSDGGPVRWFATHPDGSLLQVTVELSDPFGPAFGTKAYRASIVDAFQGTVDGADIEEVTTTNEPLTSAGDAPGLSVRMSASIDQSPRTLQMWQFRRDDLLVSFSLQAPASAFGAHKELAAAILTSAESLDSSATPAAETRSAGHIDYRVESQ